MEFNNKRKGKIKMWLKDDKELSAKITYREIAPAQSCDSCLYVKRRSYGGLCCGNETVIGGKYEYGDFTPYSVDRLHICSFYKDEETAQAMDNNHAEYDAAVGRANEMFGLNMPRYDEPDEVAGIIKSAVAGGFTHDEMLELVSRL